MIDRAVALMKSGTFQIRLSIAMLVGCLGIWPIACNTFAKDEPPFILALSVLALAYSAYGNIISSLVNKEVQAASPLASEDDVKELGQGEQPE